MSSSPNTSGENLTERRERLKDARLYVLMDGRTSLTDFSQLASSLVEAGVSLIQLRDKTLSDRPLLERARRLREITAASEALLIVNDRPDIAALSGADGVHVGQEELSVKDCRTIMGGDGLVGVSTHSLEQARQAVLDGADYIGVGPTFRSTTKNFAEFPGLELIQAVSQEIRLPAFAIGGVDQHNLHQAMQVGAKAVAVSGAIVNAPDPGQVATEFLNLLGG